MERYKKIALAVNIGTIAFAVFHFALLSVAENTIDTQSLMLVILPYGLPILAAWLAKRDCGLNKPLWNKQTFVSAMLLLACYISMVMNVTIAYGIGGLILKTVSYNSIYFNVPILYGLGFCILFFVWLLLKDKSAGRAIAAENPHAMEKLSATGRVLFALPLALMAAMVIHSGILFITELARQTSMDFPNTGFPAWGMPLIVAIIYLPLIGIAYAVWKVYRQRKRNSYMEKAKGF